MDFSFVTLTATGSAQQSSGGNIISLIVTFAIFGLIMYFFIIRPQKKKEKAEKQMRDNLRIGDEVVTIGGIYGRVVSLKEDTFVIESKSDHSKLTFARWALHSNLTVHDDDAK